MKKYLLFAGHRFYPYGGFDDFRKSFDTINEAKEWFGSNPKEIGDSYIDHWGHIVDRDTLKIVRRIEQEHKPKNLSKPGPVVEIDIDKTDWML